MTVPNAVYRVLFKDRFERGPDVVAIQKAVNARLDELHLPRRQLQIDAIYGPLTHAAALQAMYLMGVTRQSVGMRTLHPIGLSPGAQRYLRLLTKRNKAQIARGLWRLRRHRIKHAPPVTVMFDAVTVSNIPLTAPAVAGYVGGRFPTFRLLLLKFLKAKHLSIAVASTQDADCLDIEPGDSRPELAPAWVRRQQARGVKRPVVYESRDEVPAVLAALNAARVPRSGYRVWSAHFTNIPHICGPSTCGAPFQADGAQWTDKALGGLSLDQSLLNATFWD